jgi:hypothetical protein
MRNEEVERYSLLRNIYYGACTARDVQSTEWLKRMYIVGCKIDVGYNNTECI